MNLKRRGWLLTKVLQNQRFARVIKKKFVIHQISASGARQIYPRASFFFISFSLSSQKNCFEVNLTTRLKNCLKLRHLLLTKYCSFKKYLKNGPYVRSIPKRKAGFLVLREFRVCPAGPSISFLQAFRSSSVWLFAWVLHTLRACSLASQYINNPRTLKLVRKL
jgi:hypothetical protein